MDHVQSKGTSQLSVNNECLLCVAPPDTLIYLNFVRGGRIWTRPGINPGRPVG